MTTNLKSQISDRKTAHGVKGALVVPKLADEGRDLVTVRNKAGDEKKVKPMHVGAWIKGGYEVLKEK